MSEPFRPFYKLVAGKWYRADLLTCKRNDIIRPHGCNGRFIVQRKIGKDIIRCKKIIKGVHI